jgi:hypothetical protein
MASMFALFEGAPYIGSSLRGLSDVSSICLIGALVSAKVGKGDSACGWQFVKVHNEAVLLLVTY